MCCFFFLDPPGALWPSEGQTCSQRCVHVWVCVYVFLFTCMRLCICMYIYVYIYTGVHIGNCIYTYIHMLYMYMCIYIHMCVWECIYTYIYINTYICIHIYICATSSCSTPPEGFLIRDPYLQRWSDHQVGMNSTCFKSWRNAPSPYTMQSTHTKRPHVFLYLIKYSG